MEQRSPSILVRKRKHKRAGKRSKVEKGNEKYWKARDLNGLEEKAAKPAE